MDVVSRGSSLVVGPRSLLLAGEPPKVVFRSVSAIRGTPSLLPGIHTYIYEVYAKEMLLLYSADDDSFCANELPERISLPALSHEYHLTRFLPRQVMLFMGMWV
jgi:hypothetical protein